MATLALFAVSLLTAVCCDKGSRNQPKNAAANGSNSQGAWRSTDTVAIEDADVSTAIQFIRNNDNKPIQVSDVVAYMEKSRRTLEQKFRVYLGRSILSEIKQTKVNHISDLLLNTNPAITQIAYAMNFNNARHISRYFSQLQGLSPQAYRERYRETAPKKPYSLECTFALSLIGYSENIGRA